MKDKRCTKDIFIILGADFRWESALYEFYNLDNLIKLASNTYSFSSKYKIRYSTPNEYWDAIKHCNFQVSKNETWDPDMYPYSDNPGIVWTGFFTSRPNLKKTIIDFNSQFYASSALYSF